MLNPGLEALTSHYEARIQGYIPLGSRNQRYQNTLASAIPYSNLEESGRSLKGLAFGQGHNFLDTPVALLKEFGPGVEVEVGRHFSFF